MIVLPGESPRVLVTAPGPRSDELIHSLLEQGATVTVESTRPDPRLLDLASRGLVQIQESCVRDEFDIVVRDRPDRCETVTAPAGRTATGVGQVILVGGGPGNLGLLTLAGLEAVRGADVLVCDRLAPLSVLDQARPGAEIIHVGKIPRGQFTPQDAIDALLVDRARRGATVVRLKGGDAYVFGRGGEEWNACIDNGIPVSVVPGVSSALAVPALAGIPLTHRTLAQGFVVVTGHVGPHDPRSEVDWHALATLGLTIVILMGVAALDEIVRALIEAGMSPDTPAACIADGGMASMRTVRTGLDDLPEQARRAGISAPAITVIGAVVGALTPRS